MTFEIAPAPLAAIRIHSGTQSRVALNEAVVSDYADAIRAGANFPPIAAFFDGANFWIGDGFHRYFAHKQAECEEIMVEIHEGTQRDAILYSVGANAAHGLRRTNEDKRKAVETLLKDKEWSKWSDREIARRCHVNHETVGRIRSSLTGENASDKPTERAYTTKHGTEAAMNTANIGKAKREEKPAEQPKAAANDYQSIQPAEDDTALREAQHTITELAQENESLNDRLSVAILDATEEEKAQAANTISELRERVRVLEQENDALKASRDTYMHKVAEMQKQVNLWRKKAEKAERVAA